MSVKPPPASSPLPDGHIHAYTRQSLSSLFSPCSREFKHKVNGSSFPYYAKEENTVFDFLSYSRVGALRGSTGRFAQQE